MEDKKIKCIDCHKDFIFTAGEQEFFEERGYSTPIRCKDCRNKRKAEKRTSSFRRY
jgi:DNA-directed RNA polymerase subunit RPC12/RpoP